MNFWDFHFWCVNFIKNEKRFVVSIVVVIKGYFYSIKRNCMLKLIKFAFDFLHSIQFSIRIRVKFFFSILADFDSTKNDFYYETLNIEIRIDCWLWKMKLNVIEKLFKHFWPIQCLATKKFLMLLWKRYKKLF